MVGVSTFFQTPALDIFFYSDSTEGLATAQKITPTQTHRLQSHGYYNYIVSIAVEVQIGLVQELPQSPIFLMYLISPIPNRRPTDIWRRSLGRKFKNL